MHKYVIRLKRNEVNPKGHYKVVVVRARARVGSGYSVENIGFYSASTKSKIFFLNFDRFGYWLLRGAKVRGTLGKVVGRMSPLAVDSKA
jgi:ribosomal protein S16